MASRKVDELPSDAKPSPSGADQPSRCGPDDIAEELQSESTNVAVKSQKTGKFRRTALTFFGVRKSICILPSFFGGRSKNQSKWVSKKGIGKSRTHDGLSKVSHDDSLRSGFASAGDFEYHSQKDVAGALQSNCHNECSHPAVDLKSLTLGRQKKGLRSLFQSFKQHRRNVGLDKTEMTAVSSPHVKKEVPVVQDNTDQYVTECLGSEPDVPDLADVMCDIPNALECDDVDAIELENCVAKESPKSDFGDQVFDDQFEEIHVKGIVSGEYEPSRGSSEPAISQPAIKSGTPTGSSDQLNIIFGDVASLKSFDSLTGCGDIIADQEDDSITESTVSGERSRNGGKRASCYLTYQGGGEEMASPEDFDETCLQDFWGNNASEEMCCSCNPDQTEMTAELTSSHNMDALNSSSAQQAGGMDTSSIADVLTPQSEHQESVPNSDEGYYDSTTPGPEEGQEKSNRLRTGRLPRDSYSGDALYELFAPDESLISPHYENKSHLPSSKQSDYLTEPVDVTDPTFVPEINRLQISAELYKDDFVEMPSTCTKSSESAQNVVGQQEIGANTNGNLNSKPQTSVNMNNIEPDIFNEKENALASTEKITKSTNADCDKQHSSLSFGSTSDPDFETFCEPKEEHLEENKPVALPYRNINPQSQDSNRYMDDGETVCFSQALVDYTKRTLMLSDLCNNVDDLGTNTAFTPNMEALPTIVTFDVVDMHNEGEYDEQIHIELEEEISSPYQEFEDSYLQKDAFAECDYPMLDLYEQNLISNTWAVASLPRHLGLARFSQPMPNPLSLDRRSRSLDTESLELNLPNTYGENRAATVPCPQTKKDSEGDSSLYYKKNVVISASEVQDSNSIMALSPQTRSEVALSLSLTEGKITDEVQSLSQIQVEHMLFPCSSNSDLNSKLPHLSSDVSDSCELVSQNTELYSKHYRPLLSYSCLPQSTFVYPGMMEEESLDIDGSIFCKAAANLQSYNQSGKSKPAPGREGIAHAKSPLNAAVSKDVMAVLIETRASRDVACPVACSNLSEATFN
ncbi:APC membrane recruitment protein 1 [Melanotaenia boesemani]|uniref:APC membrane recruitment protein 1 n=1 Tax=Melanotaenia boesemani TaxID=1250792 RepID=UPI001C0581B6|nr:APC membrane recruitment protein 1 [Melanotaenia boesemani]